VYLTPDGLGVQSPQTNVVEALLFSAKLRLNGDIDKDTTEAYVDEVMDLVELSNIRGVIVSFPHTPTLQANHVCVLLVAPSALQF
jgi:hypothetical protein